MKNYWNILKNVKLLNKIAFYRQLSKIVNINNQVDIFMYKKNIKFIKNRFSYAYNSILQRFSSYNKLVIPYAYPISLYRMFFTFSILYPYTTGNNDIISIFTRNISKE